MDSGTEHSPERQVNLMRVRLLKLMLILALLGPMLSASQALAQPEKEPDANPALNLKQMEHHYVPEANLSALFKDDDIAAIMSLKDFEVLVQKARAAQDAKFPGGEAPVLHSANYTGRTNSEQLLVDAKITIFSSSPYSEIDLNIAGWNVLAAQIDDEPATAARVGEGNNSLRLFLPEPGTHEFNLKLSASLQRAGSDILASFGLPRASAGQFEIVVPAGKSLQFDGVTSARPAPLAEEATYRIPIGGKSNGTLRITEGTDQTRSDLLTFASTAYGVNVVPGEVTWSARTELQVFGQKIDELVFRIPQSLELTSVDSEGLESWELNDDPDHPGRVRLTLKYHQPFDGSRLVQLRGILSNKGDAPWRVADLQIANVSSHTGVLLVQYPANVRLQMLESRGVRPIADPNGKQSASAGMEHVSFAVWQEDFLLEFLTPLREQQVQAAVTTVLSAVEQGLQLQLTLSLQTRQVPLFDARVRLPADYRVTGVSRDGASVSWSAVPMDAGRNEIRVPLASPLKPGEATTLVLEVQSLPEGWPVQQSPLTIAIPDVALPQVDMLEGMLAISAPGELDLVPMELVGLEPALLQEMDALKGRLAADGQQLRLGFTYQDAPYQGQLRISRKPTLFTAETLTSFRIDREIVNSHLDANLAISGGGFRELQVQLSEFAGDRIQFRLLPQTSATAPAQIVEQVPGATNSGLRDWTLKFDRYLHGDYLLTTQVQLPRGEAPSHSPPRLVFPQANAQSGFVAIEGPEDQQVQITATEADGTPLPLVDPVDLPKGSTSTIERIVAGYRVIYPQWVISVTPTQFERERIPTAVGHALQLQSVWNPGSPFQHQASYRFTAYGMQSLLVTLPGEGTLWSAMLDGKPVDARNVEGRIQIPLVGLSSEPEHTLEIVYHTPGDPAADRGQIRGTPPQIDAVSGNGEIAPLDVLTQEWKLHYSDETLLTHSQGEFRPEGLLWQETLLTWFWNKSRQKSRTSIEGSLVILLGIALALVIVKVIWVGLQRMHGSVGCLLPTGVLALGLVVMFLVTILSQTERRATSVSRSRSAGDQVFSQPRSENLALDDLAKSAPQSMAAESDPFASRSAADKEESSQARPPAPTAKPGFDLPARTNIGDKFNQVGQSLQQTSPPASGISVNERAPHSTGGLLSIPIGLQVPEGARVSHFEFNGNDSPDQPAELRVEYMNRSTARVFVWVLVFGTLLVGWWLRHAGSALKVIYCVLTLILPLAALGLVPVLLGQVLLQGLVLGGLLGVLSWGLNCCLRCCSTFCRFDRSPLYRMWRWCCGAMMLMAALSGSIASAQDAPVAADGEPSRVIIPYKSLSEIDAAEHVYVPAPLYKQLWELAHPEDVQLEKTSVPYTVADARADVKITSTTNDERPRVQFRWVVINFTNEKQIVPLPIRQSGLESVQLDGEPGILSPLENNQVGILVPGRGTFLVDAVYTAQSDGSGDSGTVHLKLLPSATGTLTLEIPTTNEKLRLEVNSRPGDYQKTVKGDVTTFTVPMDRGPLLLNWKTTEQKEVPTENVHVETMIHADMDDAGIALSQRTTLDVKKGTLRQFVFDVPSGLAIRNVSGDDISEWGLRTEGDQSRLVITFRNPRGGKISLSADLFQRHTISEESKPFELLSLVPSGIERETGVIAISAPGQFRLRASNTTGLQQIDAKQIEKTDRIANRSEPQLGFRYISRPYQLQLDVSRRNAEATAAVDHGVQILRRKIRIASRISLMLTEVPRRVLEIQIPAGYVPLNVVCDQDCDWYVVEGESSRLVIEFSAPILNSVEISLEGQVARNPQEDSATVALPTVLHVNRMTSVLGVWCDPVFQPNLSSTGNWQARPTNELPPIFKLLQPTPPAFGFQASGTPSELTFQLIRAVAEVQGDAAILIAAGDATVDYGLTLRWKISQAATDQFALTVPDWLGNLEFTGPGIRQIHSESAGEGRTRWFVSLMDPARGEYLVTAAATVAAHSDGVIQTPRIDFETPNGVGVYNSLAMQRQFAVLVNLSASQLAPVDLAQFESVQVDQLPLNLPPQLVQQAMEIVRVRADKVPAWKIQRMARADGAQAIIPASTLTTVLQMDGSWRTQAVFAVRNRGQQFLALELPEASRILSVFVRGEPGRAVLTTLNERPIHLIALPQASAADLTFDVTLLLSGKLSQPLPEGFQLLPRSISLPVVQVVSPKESTEFGVTVAKTVWNVLVPDEVEAFPVEKGGASNVTFLKNSGWLASEEQQLVRIRSDISEMRRIVLGQGSRSQQQQALSNLKQLQAELQTRSGLASEYSIEGFSLQSSRYEDESQKAIEEVLNAVEEFQARQATPQDTAQQELSKDPSQASLRGYIVQNNDLLLGVNQAGVPTSKSGDAENGAFNFRQSIDRRLNEAKPSEKSDKARHILRQQIQSQNRIDVAPQNAPSVAPAPSMTPPMPAEGASPRERQLAGPRSPADREEQQDKEARGTSTIQGLSVAMQLPQTGHELTFERAGGNPVLTLAVRPKWTWRLLAGGAWGLVCLAVGIWLLRIARSKSPLRLLRAACAIGLVVGAGAFILLSGLPAGLGLVIFVVAGLVCVLTPKRPVVA